MNGIAYADDCQVTSIKAERRQGALETRTSPNAPQARLRLAISPLGDGLALTGTL